MSADISNNSGAKSAARVNVVMSSRGFVSIFEHIRPVLGGQQVFTLWVNLTTGKEILTAVNERRIVSYDELWPKFNFDKGTK